MDRAGRGAGNPSFWGGAPDPQDMRRNGASYDGFVIDFGFSSGSSPPHGQLIVSELRPGRYENTLLGWASVSSQQRILGRITTSHVVLLSPMDATTIPKFHTDFDSGLKTYF